MADHDHGSMNIEEQEKTFAGFVNVTKVMTIVILVVIFGSLFLFG